MGEAAVNVSDQEQRILAHVLQMLGSGQATSQSLDDYVIGYAVIGRIVAMAQGESEMAEQQRKLAWSKAFATAKQSDAKPSDRLAEALADEEVAGLRTAEIKARQRLTDLRNTREAVEQAINAIKHLERMGG